MAGVKGGVSNGRDARGLSGRWGLRGRGALFAFFGRRCNGRGDRCLSGFGCGLGGGTGRALRVRGASALLLGLRLWRCVRRSGRCKTCIGRDILFCVHVAFSILLTSQATQRCTSAFSSSTVESLWIVQSDRSAFSATGICAARRASACSRVYPRVCIIRSICRSSVEETQMIIS